MSRERRTDPSHREVPALPLRPPEQVMRLARIGSFHQSRLSFMRVLLRRLRRQNWRFDRPLWRIDAAGTGVATYRARGPDRTYTLLAFAHDLPAEQRSDRVIAEAWDATFTLIDGEPSERDIERLARNVPRQEAGRIGDRELVLSRANRSVRLFEHVVDRLSRGEQPDRELIEPVGYLMRTTAVYGSGKFGAADRDVWAGRPEFRGSFQPELLSVWLIRSFTLDLVEHLARARAPQRAVALAPELRRRFGVGNSTGLGMAPFLVNHPALLHAWIGGRETALARVRALAAAQRQPRRRFADLLLRARANARHWRVDHELYRQKIAGLRADLQRLTDHIESSPAWWQTPQPWDALYRWSEQTLGVEAQEQLVSLLIDSHGERVDDLADTLCADEEAEFRIDGTMTVGELKTHFRSVYDWALHIDFDDPVASARVWYVSEEKLEPRLGERLEEPLEPYEQPLAPGRDAARAYAALSDWTNDKTIAAFLLRFPEHRHSVRRVQLAARLRYAEIRDNTIAATMRPYDLLRCKLSFFGATKFDPRSDRWIRITMFQGAPFPDELHRDGVDPDDLSYPPATD